MDIRPFTNVSQTGPGSILLIRLAVGLIFATQGFLKYLDSNMGVARFAKIGFPYPDFTAHFVGFFEMACGLLVLVGLLADVRVEVALMKRDMSALMHFVSVLVSERATSPANSGMMVPANQEPVLSEPSGRWKWQIL